MLLPLDSASSVGTYDSEQALDLFPNHRGFSYRCDFGGQQLEQLPLWREPPKLIGIAGPATHGFRTSTKKD